MKKILFTVLLLFCFNSFSQKDPFGIQSILSLSPEEHEKAYIKQNFLLAEIDQEQHSYIFKNISTGASVLIEFDDNWEQTLMSVFILYSEDGFNELLKQAKKCKDFKIIKEIESRTTFSFDGKYQGFLNFETQYIDEEKTFIITIMKAEL